MNPQLQRLAQQLMSATAQNNPMLAAFNKMMSGKNTTEQFRTLLNAAKNKGIDVDAKIFTKEDLKTLGLNDVPAR